MVRLSWVRYYQSGGFMLTAHHRPNSSQEHPGIEPAASLKALTVRKHECRYAPSGEMSCMSGRQDLLSVVRQSMHPEKVSTPITAVKGQRAVFSRVFLGSVRSFSGCLLRKIVATCSEEASLLLATMFPSLHVSSPAQSPVVWAGQLLKGVIMLNMPSQTDSHWNANFQMSITSQNSTIAF